MNKTKETGTILPFSSFSIESIDQQQFFFFPLDQVTGEGGVCFFLTSTIRIFCQIRILYTEKNTNQLDFFRNRMISLKITEFWRSCFGFPPMLPIQFFELHSHF